MHTSDCARQTLNSPLPSCSSPLHPLFLGITFIDLASSYIIIANVQNVKFRNYTLLTGFGSLFGSVSTVSSVPAAVTSHVLGVGGGKACVELSWVYCKVKMY